MFIDTAAVGTVLSAGQAVLKAPLTLQYRYHCVRHYKILFLAVGFANAHIQIAATAGRIKIGNFKRPWRHITLVNDIPVLADHDLSVAARYPTHHR
ncbi:hypothetical protein D3C80_1801100 [compost metagenome]